MSGARAFAWTKALGAASVMVCLIAGAQAQRGDLGENNALSAGPVQILVLRSGSVVTGPFEPVPGGYVRATPYGQVVYSMRDVWCAARSLREAYQKMLQSFAEPTLSQRLALARWCVQHELYDEAEKQLTVVLSQQPENQTAKAMLEKLAAVLGKQPRFPELMSFWERLASAEPPQTLGGLPRSLAAQYMQKIQPLLYNTCGAGSCHGPFGPSRFRLIRVDRSHRVFAEQNLEAVLRYIDRRDPGRSELLLRSTDLHAARHAGHSIPTKRLTSKQLQLLRSWVQQTAEALPAEDASLFPELSQQTPKKESTNVRPVASGLTPEGSDHAGAAGKPVPSVQRWINRDLNRSPGIPDREADISDRPPSDPFDPEVFNRGLDGCNAMFPQP